MFPVAALLAGSALAQATPQPVLDPLPGHRHRQRRAGDRPAPHLLALLRRRRAQLRHDEGRPEAARPSSANSRRSRSISAPTICSTAATARRPSSGVRPTPTPRTLPGSPVYDWRGIDRIFDSYLARGVKPLVEIGFMPEAMSTQPIPTAIRGAQGGPTTRSTPAGPIRRRTTRSGASSCTSGRSTPSRNTAPPR